jgi:hypothetical protein
MCLAGMGKFARPWAMGMLLEEWVNGQTRDYSGYLEGARYAVMAMVGGGRVAYPVREHGETCYGRAM